MDKKQKQTSKTNKKPSKQKMEFNEKSNKYRWSKRAHLLFIVSTTYPYRMSLKKDVQLLNQNSELGPKCKKPLKCSMNVMGISREVSRHFRYT